MIVLLSSLESHSREKRLLLDEIVQMKKEKDLVNRDNERKDSQIQEARDELDKTVTALRGADTKIQLLRNQVILQGPSKVPRSLLLILWSVIAIGL